MGRLALSALLGALGIALKVASTCSRRFRAQITQDLTLEITSTDGVAHHYVFARENRFVRSCSGSASGTVDLSVNFDSAWLGFRTLVRPDAVGAVVKLFQARRATYSGNAVHVLWFWGLRSMVLPYGRDRRLRQPLPGALVSPNSASKVTDRITREPVALELDPEWKAAAVARSQMAMVRGSRGGHIPMW